MQDYPALSVEAYAGDYDAALPRLGESLDDDARALVLFLGSNIGNFDRAEARDFLRRVRRVLRAGDRLLVGADLKKDPAALEAAYDDALGVTAAFNLNLLARINRELAGDFELDRFGHYAYYNPRLGRIEMHLLSLRDQRVRVDGDSIRLRDGESIFTESSYKYTLAEFEQLAGEAGYKLKSAWLDDQRLFSVQYFLA